MKNPNVKLVLILVAISMSILIITRFKSEETFVPNGQEYRPSGASEGYGVEFMKKPTEDMLVFEGASNYLYGVGIDGLTDDPDVHETAIYIGEGWDCLFEIENEGCLAINEDGYLAIKED